MCLDWFDFPLFLRFTCWHHQVRRFAESLLCLSPKPRELFYNRARQGRLTDPKTLNLGTKPPVNGYCGCWARWVEERSPQTISFCKESLQFTSRLKLSHLSPCLARLVPDLRVLNRIAWHGPSCESVNRTVPEISGTHQFPKIGDPNAVPYYWIRLEGPQNEVPLLVGDSHIFQAQSFLAQFSEDEHVFQQPKATPSSQSTLPFESLMERSFCPSGMLGERYRILEA